MKSSLEMEQVRFELMSQSVPTASQKSTSEKVLSEPTGGEGTEVDLSAQADDITKEQERPNSSKAGTLIGTRGRCLVVFS
jgi:hypothetical protein